MDDDMSDLIVQLCTTVGMIMEDASVDALMLSSHHRSSWQEALESISGAVATTTKLVHAAQALHAWAMRATDAPVGRSTER